MSIIRNLIDWYASNRAYAATASSKYRTPRTVPGYVPLEVGTLDTYGIPSSWYQEWDEKQQQKLAMNLSWIYSNIIRIGNEVSSAGFNVYQAGSNETDIAHPFEKIMRHPNPFFDGRSLLKYTIWGLSLDSYGAFWFITPDRNTGMPVEIWPIMVGRIEPIKDRNNFIKHYLYTAKDGAKIKIKKEFICRFFYPHPTDMWRSFPPLQAAGLPISVYQGVTTAQRDTFTEGRGVPLSVLSLDANISDPDFARARQRIRDDWEDAQRIAVVRAGSLDVETVGLSNRDLEVIAASEYTRDELDAVFMGGIMWRRAVSASERDEINKEIKESVIHPLHMQLAAQINLEIITPFYGEQFYGEFEDVRAQDRSITLQENQLYWRPMTVDQTLADRGLPPWKWNGHVPDDLEEGQISPFEDYGSLPYALAMNASFVTTYYALGTVKDPMEKPEEIGNTEGQLDPERVVDELAGGDQDEEEESVDLKAAAVEGIAAELRRYRTVLRRTWRENEDPLDLAKKDFKTTIIPTEVMDQIKGALPYVANETELMDLFAEWLQ